MSVNGHYDTIIVGGGPAGAVCGYVLARGGSECLIIDRYDFPREKICGGGLTPKAYMLVERIFGELQYDYMSVSDIEIYCGQRYVCTFHVDPAVRTVQRRDFDYVLLNAYREAGGRVLTGTVKGATEEDGKIYVSLSSGDRFSCDHLVGADGANSRVREYLQSGFQKGYLLLEKNFGGEGDNIKVWFDDGIKNGYVYLFPNRGGCVAGYGGANTSPDKFTDYLERLIVPRTEGSKAKGAYIPMHDRMDYPFRDNIILVGDAGGYADAMTGEGLYYAMRSSENAALSILTGLDFRRLNKSVINTVAGRRKMARLFYCKPVNRLFMSMCRNRSLMERINRRVNAALSE